jgi:branched-chain amino acid transport system ATP-binding protein
MTFFKADDLAINFGGIRALDGVTFEVEPGQVFTIIGPNGAGKTTIFNLVSRIYEPSQGRLIFRDEDITRVPPHEIARRGIALAHRAFLPFFVTKYWMPARIWSSASAIVSLRGRP